MPIFDQNLRIYPTIFFREGVTQVPTKDPTKIGSDSPRFDKTQKELKKLGRSGLPLYLTRTGAATGLLVGASGEWRKIIGGTEK